MLPETRHRLPLIALSCAGLLAVALFGAVACSSDNEDKTPARTELPPSLWYEDCNACGAEWEVTLQEGETGGAAIVRITNTGERGLLRIRAGEVKGYALNAEQAAEWQKKYPQARADRDAIRQLEAQGHTSVTLVARPASQGIFTIARGQTYAGVFLAQGNRIPADARGLVLLFGPIDAELTPPGQATTDNWVTWDTTRPFFTIGSQEVTVKPVTPAASPGATPARP